MGITKNKVIKVSSRSENVPNFSPKLFNQLFASIPEAVFLVDENNIIVYCNEKATSVYFYSKEKLLGTRIDSYSVNGNNTKTKKLEHAEVEQIQIKNGLGMIVEIERTIVQLKKDNFDSVTKIIYDVDLTSKIRSEELIHLHSTALEATAISTVITNLSGDVVWINSAFTELTGYAKDEILYKNVRILKSGKHDQKFYENLWDTILAGKVWHGEIINKNKKGFFYTEEQTITPVFNNDGIITHFIGVKQNVTARKKWELKIKGLNIELEKRVDERTQQLEESNSKLNQYVKRIERDLEAGRKIQFRLLPDKTKVYDKYEFSRYLIPSLYLSGDFLDYFTIDENNIGFYFADVCGHGASSAFVTVFLKAFIDGYLKKYKKHESSVILDPERLLTRLNLDLIDEDLDKHLTIFYGVLNRKQNTMAYVNCGNFPYPILYDGVKAISLDQKGAMPIGFYKKAEFRVNVIELPKSFSLMMVSDGILEIMNQKSILGKQVFLENSISSIDISINDLIKKLKISNEKIIPDDITFLILKRKE